MQPPNYPIIILSSDRLNNSYSSAAQSIAKELSHHHQVYFINRPYTFKDVLRSLRRGGLGDANPWRLLFGKIDRSLFRNYTSLESVHVPATLPINWLKSKRLYNLLQKYNDWVTYRTIQKIVKKDQIDNYVFLTSYNPYYLPFVHPSWRGIRPMVNIYQSRDDISQDQYTGKHGVHLEQKAVAHADFVLVTSHMLKLKLEKLNKNTFELNNGVAYDMFEKAVTEGFPKPKELEACKGRVIGYTGNLDENRVDYGLLKHVAKSFPTCTLLLVGPITCSYFYDEGLDKIENILSIGSRDISELPEYLAYMDVAIIPFLKNGFTESVYPLKLNEYLAAGKATVSIDFSADVRSFSETIEIADSYEEFASKIKKLLEAEETESTINERLSIARENSWKKRVSQLHDLIDLHRSKKTLE